MNKTSLINAVNSFLVAIVTIEKVKNSLLQLINELFQTTYNQSNTPAGNQFTYNLKFKKIGNIVYIDGWVRNDYPTINGNMIVCTITNPLYNAKTGQDTLISYTNYLTKQSGLISVAESNLYILSNEGSGAFLYINAHYQTND